MAEERESSDAVRLANAILDRPFADPDDDLAILSRQLLRARERIDRLTAENEKLWTAADAARAFHGDLNESIYTQNCPVCIAIAALPERSPRG